MVAEIVVAEIVVNGSATLEGETQVFSRSGVQERWPASRKSS